LLPDPMTTFLPVYVKTAGGTSKGAVLQVKTYLKCSADQY